MGIYEYRKQLVFASQIPRGSVVYDVGAHVGFYTLLASRLVGPTGRVVSFEPLPRNVTYLRQHLALNRTTNVQVIEAAVADQDGVLTFAERGSSYMGRLERGGQQQVSTVYLDGLLEHRAIPPPNYLKIDIEGGEVRALNGGLEMLRRYRPTLFLATHGSGPHRECVTLLQNQGYTVKPLIGHDLANTDELVARYQ
jgi:FkbM family methyltransferase